MRLITIALAFLSLAGATIAQDKTLTPEVNQLQWNGWLVKVDDLEFKSSILRYGVKNAGPDSTFVRLAMTVKNNSNHGESFIPQNDLKIVIGANEYDAQDLDSNGESYMDNIEPTLVRTRLCYFELPTAQVKNSFILRFQGFLTEVKTVKVAIANAPRPDPISTPVAHLEPAMQPQGSGIEITRLPPTPTPSKLSLESAQADLAHAWTSLSPEERAKLGQEEQKWIKKTNSLPEEERIENTAKRANYLWSLVGRSFDE